MQAVDKAKTDYRLAVANGSTDPTFGLDIARDPPIPIFFGVSITIPLRIFDRNRREGTHAARYGATTAFGRGRAEAGFQRCRFGLRRSAE